MTRLTKRLCAIAAVAGALATYPIAAEAQAPQQATRAPRAPAPVPGSAALFSDGAKLTSVLASEAAKSNALAVSAVHVTDRAYINLVRRGEGAGALAHAGWTEVHYIVDGGAEFVTGGVLNRAAAGAGGGTITGGFSKKISKGDIVIVPANTPHQYKAVDGFVTYLEIRFPDVVASNAPSPEKAPPAGSAATYFSAADLAAVLKAEAAKTPAQAVSPIKVTDHYSINEVQRRGALGPAGAHLGWTELHFILDGAGTLVTAGKLVPAPGGGTAKTIEGGVTQKMKAGDAAIIPADANHQYKDMAGAVTYLEVRFPNAPPPAN